MTRAAVLVLCALCALAPAGAAQASDQAAARAADPAAAQAADRAADGAPRPALVPVPVPNLDSAEEAIRKQLTTARTNLDALVQDRSVPAADLGGAFGRMGQLYLLYSFDEAAEAAFNNAWTLSPKDARWAYYLGVIAQRQGRWDEARKDLETVIEARPQDVPSLLRLGRVALEQRDTDRAAELFERALALDPRSAAAHHGLGKVAAARRDYQTAVDHYTKALELDPNATAVHYELGLAYRQLGDLDKAREQLSMRGEGEAAFYDPLVNDLGQLSAGPTAAIERGNAASAKGDLETATLAYREALEADPDNRRARQALATILARRGRTDEAIAMYQKLLADGEDDAVTHYNYGNLLVEAGKPEAAIEHFQRAAELAPDFEVTYHNLAKALQQVGRYKEAEAAAAKAVETAPEDTTPRLLHAELVVRNAIEGHSDAEVVPILTGLAQKHPEDAAIPYAAASELQRRGHAAEATELFRSVLALDGPEEILARAHIQLANLVWDRDGDPADGLAHLRKATELAPGMPEGHLALARGLGRTGDYLDAAAELDRAIELETGDPDPQVYFARATALMLAGRDVRARRSLEEALKRLPDDVSLRHALARLLAASKDPEVRDGSQALALSREIFQHHPTIDHAETVAMALATLGRYDEAVAWQQKVIAKAESLGRQDRLEALRQHLALYQQHQPVRAPWRQ